MDVSVEFSVYKSPYNNCCQVSVFPLRIHVHQNRCRLGLRRLGKLTAYSAPPDPLAAFKGAASRQEGNGGRGGLGEGIGGMGKGKLGE